MHAFFVSTLFGGIHVVEFNPAGSLGGNEKMFEKDLAESNQIQWDTWKKRSLLQKFKESFSHIFVHWL